MGARHSGVGERLSTSICVLAVEMDPCSTWKADGRKILEEEAGPCVSTRLHRTPRNVKAIQENDVCSTLFEVHWQRSRSIVEGRAASTRGGEPPYDGSGKFLASRREASPQQTLPTPPACAAKAHQLTAILHERPRCNDLCTTACAKSSWPRRLLQSHTIETRSDVGKKFLEALAVSWASPDPSCRTHFTAVERRRGSLGFSQRCLPSTLR